MTESASAQLPPDPSKPLPPAEIDGQLPEGWRRQDQHLSARYATGTFRTGLGFVNRVGDSAERWDHHPDIEITYGEVGFTLYSHDIAAITSRDLRMARLIAEHATAMGLSPSPDPARG